MRFREYPRVIIRCCRVFIALVFLNLLCNNGSAESPAKFHFDIPALPLQEAILEFALARELEVVFVTKATTGLKANALVGEYPLPEALDILFADTGLRARFTTERSILIERKPKQILRPKQWVEPRPNKQAEQRPKPILDPTENTIEEVFVVAKLISPYRLGVTSSSTKTQRRFLETPQLVNTVSQQVIKDTGSRDYSDASQWSSSVDFLEASSGVTKELRLRGFAYPALKINGYSAHAYTRAPNLGFIESIDIAKGPTSVLYGRMEPGGVINMMLKRPNLENDHSIQLRTSDLGYRKITLDIAGELYKDAQFRAIAFDQQEGKRENFDQDDNRGIYFILEKELGQGASASLSYRFESQNASKRFGRPANLVNQEIQIAEVDGKFLLIDSIQNDLKTRVDLDTHAIALALENMEINGWGVNLQLQYDLYQSTSLIRYPFIEEDAIADISEALIDVEEAEESGDQEALNATIEILEEAAAELDIQPEDISSFDASVDNEAKFFTSEATVLKRTDLFGLDFEQLYGVNATWVKPQQLIFQNHDTRGTFNINDSYLTIHENDTPIDVTELNFAVFSQWIFDIHENATFFIGGRYDYIDLQSASERNAIDKTFKEFSGRAGATINITDESSIYANYSSAFTPQFIRDEETIVNEENGEETEEDIVRIPSPSKSRQWEIGLKQEWFEEELQTSCAFFEMKKSRIVARTKEQLNRGFECDALGQINDRWNILFSHNRLDAEITESFPELEGNTPRVTPKEVTKIWLSYHQAWNHNTNIGFGLGTKHVSDRFADDENEVVLEAYNVLDFSFFYEYRGFIELHLHIKNAFDTVYDEGAFDNLPFWITEGQPRTIELALEYSF